MSVKSEQGESISNDMSLKLSFNAVFMLMKAVIQLRDSFLNIFINFDLNQVNIH